MVGPELNEFGQFSIFPVVRLSCTCSDLMDCVRACLLEQKSGLGFVQKDKLGSDFYDFGAHDFSQS
jgi:hypothetical protein